ncbi:MAG: HAMP domain-containing histidine kinase [Thioclava marina]|uniref:histidine kinase n=1 Tax=Thioclava marina TaxID=1915077 RepID=A0ABX3MPD2_9RHOB|nr:MULTISPECIES: HAMP domain-containing sensor histidine kinase [Thioclava]TNE83879.1 MAG: HAMP domain-containing histidine kinase [Paracoccaceae bacterium]MBC7145004.1 HAMP domain-containing histidine kinase [Thioclava marina]MBD3803609.1 HAMP domain-containing histidine kinase [Thioclava sp.]OOY13392.1 sensor histidine kinase [Thioclava marina]OOY29105.1 sensor histidine kinase [Thioclava sp. L04-15]
MKVNTLSGRFLILTTVFVVLAEALILLPGLANFREDYLLTRLERAQIASLALLTTDTTIAPDLEKELLANAGVFNVVLRRDAVRQLVLSSPIPSPVTETYDLRNSTEWTRIRDAVHALFDVDNKVIRVLGEPVQKGGIVIEVTLATEPMRIAMVEYGLRLLSISAVFSMITAVLLFFLVRRLMVVPIKRLVAHMAAYAEAPEDARRIITPQAGVEELRVAEEALASMQTQLTSSLRQKERLAQLGQAVAKISHDLRNILTTAQLFADRMESSEDPGVKRAAPKLMGSIGRAINLCETTLAFGKAKEPPPTLSRFMFSELAQEVLENEEHPGDAPTVEFITDVPPNLVIRADREQLYRVLNNLVRNARQAIEATGSLGTIEIGAGENSDGWWIRVQDSGPGLPERAREHLFQPFTGGTRAGGTGLGLAIAAELVRGHGGRLDLVRTDETGTEFRIFLPSGISFDGGSEKAACAQS